MKYFPGKLDPQRINSPAAITFFFFFILKDFTWWKDVWKYYKNGRRMRRAGLEKKYLWKKIEMIIIIFFF